MRAVAIEVRAVGQRTRSGEIILRDVSLAVDRGELVAIIGASGAGKTTLLDAMSGLRSPWSGSVLRAPGNVGYVPQGDAIHTALPLARTLRYAAALREVAGPGDRDAVVAGALRVLDLSGRSQVPVGDLSGGERKRASIAAELLAKPGLFFLDEPTSGLDPARGSELMRVLRRLCDNGTTVVLTTHNPLDADRCDKIAVLANGGHLAFFGTPGDAREYFGADSLGEIYERLAGLGDPAKAWSRRFFPFSRTMRGSSPTQAIPPQPGSPILLSNFAGPLSAGPVSFDRAIGLAPTDAATTPYYFAAPALANADLANADLANADLANADPANADPANADPANADLANADLANADPANADPANADPANADPANADLAKADLGNADPAATDPAAPVLDNALANAGLDNADNADNAVPAAAGAVAAPATPAVPGPPATPGALRSLRQWSVLTRRNAETLARARLTLAILVGSPVAVLLMFLVLFRPGAFAPASPSPAATVMILFWVAFGGFFFGLTYGLLQICAEFGVLRRERFAGLSAVAYVLAKAAVLVPLLALVDLLFILVLRVLGRLPAAGDYPATFVTLLLSSVAALGLGLLISAAVSEPSQATIAMPIVCFPQVLFVGAILPVPAMALVGRWISYAMTNRWAFEGLGHSLGVVPLWANGGSPLGAPLLASYGTTFGRAVAVDWLILAAFAVAFFAATIAVVVRKTRSSASQKREKSPMM